MVINAKEGSNDTSLCANSTVEVVTPKTMRTVRHTIATNATILEGGSPVHVV